MVMFHGNAGKKLRRHAKSQLRTNIVLAITSTRIDKALSGPTGIQEKMQRMTATLQPIP